MCGHSYFAIAEALGFPDAEAARGAVRAALPSHTSTPLRDHVRMQLTGYVVCRDALVSRSNAAPGGGGKSARLLSRFERLIERSAAQLAAIESIDGDRAKRGLGPITIAHLKRGDIG
jgi:hypothetical protein